MLLNQQDEWPKNKQRERNKMFSDDGTKTFLWKPHTILVLVFMLSVLLYVALIEKPVQNTNYNMKRGLIACASFFVLFGVTQTADGPFIRPHPAFWRLIFVLSVLYEICLVYILFQTVDDARQFLTHLDPNLGVPLPDKDYGGNCLIYDPDVPDNPWHNFWDKMDGFVANHFIGWWLKTMVLRDYWICMIMSFLFELLEFSLQHQLPNFSECWWDHWILDFILCNGIGIYLGMKTCEYLSLKPYNWRGIKNIPTFKGKLIRIASQFGPYSWMEYEWRPMASFKHWIIALTIIFVYNLAELGTFYLKFILWIPPPHFLVLGRLMFLLLASSVAMREGYEYLDNPKCKRLGAQCWICSTILFTELMIVLKFDWKLVTMPPPWHIQVIWMIIALGVVLITIWQFSLKPQIQGRRAKRPSMSHQANNNNSAVSTNTNGNGNGNGNHSPGHKQKKIA